MSLSRREYIVRGAGVAFALLVLTVAVVLAVFLSRGTEGTASAQGESGTTVEVVKPQVDKSFKFEPTQPAYIVPYYTAELRAQVGGVVADVPKPVGETVVKGEPLILIDVPDLEAELAMKNAVIQQREDELDVARARQKRAEALVKIANSAVDEKRAEVRVSLAMEKFRGRELRRFRGLARDDSVTADIVDERQKFYEAAQAESDKARASVKRARADVDEAEAKLLEAKSDKKLKTQLIDVAHKDTALTKARLTFATVRAPWDGRIIHRYVDPGAFVQNSTSSPGPTLLTLQREDLLTVYANVPDNYAPDVHEYVPGVSDATEVLITIPPAPGLPAGLEIRAVVTRTSHTLLTSRNDRTLRVEIDLFNRSRDLYSAFLEAERKNGYRGLKERDGKRLPVLPAVVGQRRVGLSRPLPVLTGTYCSMKLLLHDIKETRVLPSSAVFRRGGKPYVCIVRNGKIHRIPVTDPVDNGFVVKVRLIEGRILRELGKDELVVCTDQGALREGEAVQVAERTFDPKTGRIQ